jgi:hypothetical protein
MRTVNSTGSERPHCFRDRVGNRDAAELVGKFVHADGRALIALQAARAHDPSPVVRRKAGWFTPGGAIYKRTIPRPPRQRDRP